MNKKFIVWGLVIVIVAGIGGYFVNKATYSPSPNPSEQVVDDNQKTKPTTPSQKNSKSSQDIVFTPINPTAVSFPSIFTNTSNTSIYKVGVVNSGTYTGGDVWLVSAPSGGPGGNYSYHFINQNGKITYLTKNSDELYEGDSMMDESKFTIDTTSSLTQLNFPEKIYYNGLTFSLNTTHNTPGVLFSNKFQNNTTIKLVFTDPKLGDVYMDATKSSGGLNENGFYAKAPDGTVRTYSLDIAFYDKAHNMPAITWSDGTINSKEYINQDRTGCGGRSLVSVPYGISMSDLTANGKTSTGDIVYQLTNSNNTILQGIYKNEYNPYNTPKLSYEDFVKAHPAFFWVDSFGRIIKFQRADFVPQAECGKPVIYLYPQKTTEVSVKIDPQGGLTKSEPAYNKVWNVIATPDSQLTEVSTGKIYPYLFWEGRGGLYKTPEKGFVVASQNVHGFLLEKLSALGLNQKESVDFMDFWEPYMTGAPYFFVTFLGTHAMNNIAPLTISPKPDTVIRILMDFSPLQKPVTVEGYDIKTPTRKGFTVVEWGGVLR